MRLIDADALMTWFNNHYDDEEVTVGYISGLIKEQPTIEEHKKGMTLDEVAELLSNMFGDDCACNFNNIDEWLPMSCKYSETTCPQPNEPHGCWKQFLVQGGVDMRGEKNERSR